MVPSVFVTMALRHTVARFAAFGSVSVTRAFGTSAMRASDLQKESIASFMTAFESVKPSTMDNPSTPSDFLKPLPPVPAQPPAKLTLNFFVPHNVEFSGVEVEQVQVPAFTGDMGVLPGHVPTVVQMRPGVVSVTHSDKEVQKVRNKVVEPATEQATAIVRSRRGRDTADRAARKPYGKRQMQSLVPVCAAAGFGLWMFFRVKGRETLVMTNICFLYANSVTEPTTHRPTINPLSSLFS